MNVYNLFQSRKKQLFFLITCLLFLFINALFAYKYGIRQHKINIYVLEAVYLFFILFTSIAILKIKLSDIFFKYLFFIGTILFFIFTLILNYFVDGNTVIVDRWSAMTVGIEALFEGEYVYAARDHLNGRTSNLPGLILLGIPFYFIGSVGYLQSFTFLVFVYMLHNNLSTYREKVFGLFLLVISCSYLWEIYCKSDMMSNFIVLLLFILWAYKNKLNTNQNLLITSLLSAFFVLTRLVTVIPLSLLLVRKFFKLQVSRQLIFTFVFIVTALLLLILVFKDYPSLEIVKLYNPIELQNRQLPIYLSVITIITPFLYAFKKQTFEHFLASCIIFLSVPIFISFIIKVVKGGMSGIIEHSFFDISYFNILSPFLIFYIASNFSFLNHNLTTLKTKNSV